TMGQRAAELHRFFNEVDAMPSKDVSPALRIKADCAARERDAIEDAFADMMATTPAGAVHQLAAAMGLVGLVYAHDLDDEEQMAYLRSVNRLLMSAFRVMLPVAGLTPGDTLIDYHTTPAEYALTTSPVGADPLVGFPLART